MMMMVVVMVMVINLFFMLMVMVVMASFRNFLSMAMFFMMMLVMASFRNFLRMRAIKTHCLWFVKRQLPKQRCNFSFKTISKSCCRWSYFSCFFQIRMLNFIVIFFMTMRLRFLIFLLKRTKLVTLRRLFFLPLNPFSIFINMHLHTILTLIIRLLTIGVPDKKVIILIIVFNSTIDETS